MVAQLLLEETDHARSLLVSTIVKHALYDLVFTSGGSNEAACKIQAKSVALERYKKKSLSWQKIGCTTIARSHGCLPEVVGPAHLEIICTCICCCESNVVQKHRYTCCIVSFLATINSISNHLLNRCHHEIHHQMLIFFWRVFYQRYQSLNYWVHQNWWKALLSILMYQTQMSSWFAST